MRILPGSVCVDLKAGDGMINQLEILHWASDYSPTHFRRTFHLGYRTFEGPRFFYEGFEKNIDFSVNLSTAAQTRYKNWFSLYRIECNVVVATFRSIIDRNEKFFCMG